MLTLQTAIFLSISVAMLSLAFSCSAAAENRIQPYAKNPYYWQYKDKPILLLGGSDDDNLFQWTGSRLIDQLDLLVSVGGNYLRNTMSDRDEGNIYPFKKLGNGKYDLNQWNDDYWKRLDDFLRETHKRAIIVQIEVWDAFDWTDTYGYSDHPWNPENNVNYTTQESGLPTPWPHSPHQKDSPFAQTIPGLANAGPGKVVLPFQQKFVAKVLQTSLKYDHVLFTIQNETSSTHEWSDYWANFLHEKAAAAGTTVEVSDMREEDRPARSKTPHQHQIDRPQLYTFLDSSKNSRDETGEDHWKGIIDIRSRLSQKQPRPVNNTKIVQITGDVAETTERWWRNIIGGVASERFHRPVINWLGKQHGLGLESTAQKLIKGTREITDAMNIFTCEPRNDLLKEREENEAYCLAEPGQQYTVYFPQAGQVALDTSAATGRLAVHWYDIEKVEWLPAEDVSNAGSLKLKTPGDGHWAVVIKAVE